VPEAHRQKPGEASFMIRKLIASTSTPQDAMAAPTATAESTTYRNPAYPSIAWWTKPVTDVVALTWDRMSSMGLARGFVVEEACSGVGTGTMSLEALGVPLGSSRVYSDKKDSCRRFLVEKLRLSDDSVVGSHVFKFMREHAAGEGYCYFHGQECRLQDEQVADCMVMGPPCQAFSSQHGHRSNGCEAHPLYETLIGAGDDSVINLLRRRLPRSFVLENAGNFIKADPVSGEIPANVFLSRLKDSVVNSDKTPFYTGIHVFHMDAMNWLSVSRPRTVASPSHFPNALSMPFGTHTRQSVF
jgi:hypothetical protein